MALPAAFEFHPCRAAIFNQHAVDMGPGNHFQVRAPPRLAQIALFRAAPPAVALGGGGVEHPFHVAAVVFVAEIQAGLLATRQEHLAKRMMVLHRRCR